MQLILLAAGKGKRMRPLTETLPKPLIPVNGKPILDIIFEALPEQIDSIIIVVGYLGDKIREHCGNNFHGRPIIYVEGLVKGTALDFLEAKPYINDDRFILMNGDEIPLQEDIEACLVYESSVLCWEVDDPWNHGIAVLRDDGSIKEVLEKPDNPPTNLLSNGIIVLTRKIFDYEPEKLKGEYYFTSMLNQYVKDNKVMPVISEHAIGGLSSPDDIKRVEEILKNREKDKNL